MPQVATAPHRPGSGRRSLVAPAVCTAVFVIIAALVWSRWSVLTAFDRRCVIDLNQVDGRSSVFLDLMRTVSDVASTTGWLVVLGATTIWLAARRQWRSAAFVAVAATGSPVLNALAKAAVHRPRPTLAHPVEVAGGWSFPSGHTQAATVGCAVLLIIARPRLGRAAVRTAVVFAAVVVALVALSRMSLGVHYPSDVTASVFLGSAWALGAAWLVLPRPPESRPGPGRGESSAVIPRGGG